MQPQILVPLDGSERAEAIIPPIASLARATHSSVFLLKVNVPLILQMPVAWTPPPGWTEEEMMISHDYLAGIARRLLAQGVRVHIEVASGHPATNIVACAGENPAIVLIALATHARNGLSRFVPGSVTDQVVRSASKPVVLLHPDHETSSSPQSSGLANASTTLAAHASRTILVPLDGSNGSERALPPVQRLATASGATIVLVSVVPLLEEKEGKKCTLDTSALIKAQAEAMRTRAVYLEAKARQLRAAGVRVRTEVIIGKPSIEIQHACKQEQACMVVMAVHERNLFQRLCQSGTAVDVVRNVHLPVMLVRVRDQKESSQEPVLVSQERPEQSMFPRNTSQMA